MCAYVLFCSTTVLLGNLTAIFIPENVLPELAFLDAQMRGCNFVRRHRRYSENVDDDLLYHAYS